MKVCGIDDSGKGPVIGPMIMAGVMIPSSLEKKFRELGIKDSKKLGQKKREILAEIIKKNSDFCIIKILPEEIDMRLVVGLDLNKLEAIKAAQIINELRPDKAIIDCPSANIEKWKAELEKHIDEKIKKRIMLVVEHKADVNYVVCSAASILAKVTREKEISKLKKYCKIDFGSGYPSDPLTKKFLEQHGSKYKEIFRQTWQTWKIAKAKKEQKSLDEF